MSQNDAKLNGTGAPRKPLSEQLDRLDTILDALDVGLNEVVADAVRKAATAAAQQTADAVAREMLTNPEVARAAAQSGQTAAPPAAAPSWVPPLLDRARRLCQLAWAHRLAVGSSLAAGLIAFFASYLCGPTASSLALAALGATVGAAFASRPARLFAWITGRAD